MSGELAASATAGPSRPTPATKRVVELAGEEPQDVAAIHRRRALERARRDRDGK